MLACQEWASSRQCCSSWTACRTTWPSWCRGTPAAWENVPWPKQLSRRRSAPGASAIRTEPCSRRTTTRIPEARVWDFSPSAGRSIWCPSVCRRCGPETRIWCRRRASSWCTRRREQRPAKRWANSASPCLSSSSLHSSPSTPTSWT